VLRRLAGRCCSYGRRSRRRASPSPKKSPLLLAPGCRLCRARRGKLLCCVCWVGWGGRGRTSCGCRGSSGGGLHQLRGVQQAHVHGMQLRLAQQPGVVCECLFLCIR